MGKLLFWGKGLILLTKHHLNIFFINSLVCLFVFDVTVLPFHSMAEPASAFSMAEPASTFSMAEPAFVYFKWRCPRLIPGFFLGFFFPPFFGGLPRVNTTVFLFFFSALFRRVRCVWQNRPLYISIVAQG